MAAAAQPIAPQAAAFPERIRQMCEQAQMPIDTLPVLDLQGRPRKDYIDFLTLADLSHPVMRFVELTGRAGLAFKLTARASIAQQIDHDPSAQTYSNVYTLFPRDARPDLWVHAWGNSAARIEILYRERHEQTHMVDDWGRCDQCPVFEPGARAENWNRFFLPPILQGQDPDFTLADAMIP